MNIDRLFMAWILYFARSISSTLTLYGKDRAMNKAQHTVADLEQRVHQLEVDQARLKTTISFSSEIRHHTLA